MTETVTETPDRPPPGVDVARLRDVLEFVTAEPDRWDQASWYRVAHDVLRGTAAPGADWTCATSACLAGWVALRAGWEPRIYRRGDATWADNETVRSATDPDAVEHVRDVATELLGLTPEQAVYLFHADNNLRDLWEFAAVLTDGAVAVPTAVRDAVEPLHFDPESVDVYRRLALS